MPDVLLYFDATDQDPHRLRGSKALVGWLTALGVDAGRCREFRVFGNDTVQVIYYARRGPDGKYAFNRHGDVRMEVHTVPLTVPIPPELDVLRDTGAAPADQDAAS